MKRRLLVALCLVATSVAAVPPARAAFPQIPSPPGQIYVVSVNTWQRKVIGVKRFEMMLELTRALLKRPPAFDGGSEGVAAAPDVIVLQEMPANNLDIFVNLLRQRSDFDYRAVGSETAFGKFVINADRIAMNGAEREWNDVCYEATQQSRTYQWAEFTESETGSPFAVAGIHFSPAYQENTGQSNCLERNIPVLRSQLDQTPHPTIIAGDFNKRAVEQTHECDPEEQSPPLQWWSEMTAPADGRVYDDAIVTWHRAQSLSLAEEWTHEQKTASVTCDASTRFRRNRIDYMFTSGVEIASVHTDHPGFAGEEPGTRHPTNARYSDHRFIAARLSLTGPATPAPPTVVPDAGGIIHVSWAAAEAPISEWLLYRAIGDNPYSLLTRLTPETLTFDDSATEHGNRYRYALAAVDAAGAQGIESQPATARADAIGPRVKSTTPRFNARAAERRTDVIVRFNEPLDPASVSTRTINLFRSGRSVCGRTVQERPHVLVFDPCLPLGKKKEYRAVVYALNDLLGNRGTPHQWRFTTR
ncbi:MAG: Ig-like domain-containing protein [Actinomycetota bacterium]|nr:Ig-like domain-containing protein [Actinomycetota bacterium]